MTMSISRRGAFRLAFGLVSLAVSAAGLSAAASATVNIVGMPGGGTQSLPIKYVQSFQRWVVQDRQVLSRVCNTTISEIEWSDDIKIRPTLDVLIKSGAPSYVMTGLQIRRSNQDLCPLARQWTTFSFAVEPTFRVETFLSNNNNDEISHEALVLNDNPVEQMKQAMELFGIVLSQIGEGSPLSEGFHIMSIPLKTDWSALPSPESGSLHSDLSSDS